MLSERDEDEVVEVLLTETPLGDMIEKDESVPVQSQDSVKSKLEKNILSKLAREKSEEGKDLQ